MSADLDGLAARVASLEGQVKGSRIKMWRVIEAARERLYCADVVAELPESAPIGRLIVTPGNANLFVGAGDGAPLRRIPTTAMSL